MSRRSKPAWTAALILAGVLSLVAAACRGDDDTVDVVAEDQSLHGMDLASEREIEAAAVALEAPTTDAADPATGPVAQAIELGRDIIYTADLTVAVSTIADSEREAIAVVTSTGGFLFGQQTVGDPEARSVLVFKVPPERFEEALRRLGDLGTVRSQNVQADDVTERVVDLESRIRSAQASVERLNAFLAEATDIKAIAELEAQLLERETALETLRGQLRTLEDRVEYATISLVLTEALSRPEMALVVTAYPGSDGTAAACPGEGNLLSIVAGDPATVCFEITNAGDTPLRDFDLSDPVLGISFADTIVVFGDPSASLLPGQSLLLAAETVVERDIRTQTTVNATPVDDEGRPVETRSIASVAVIDLVAEDPGGLPGFGDGLRAGAEVIQLVGGTVVLAAGLLLPLLPILLLGGLFVWWRRRRVQASSDVAA